MQSGNALVIQWALKWGIMFASAYASNTFLVLAAGALYPQEQFLRRVWGLRLVIDALVAMGVPPLLRFLFR